MGATIGPIRPMQQRQKEQEPKQKQRSMTPLEAARRWLWVWNFRDKDFLAYREKKPFTTYAGTRITDEAWNQAWQEEFDRRYLLRPAAFVDTDHALLLKPSCK